jgi:hypothetical protein
MNDKDKQLLKDSALVVADQIVSSIPALNIAWGLSKALFSAGMKLRQQKVLEWVEMIRDHPEVFTKKLLSQEEFQDGFALALEKYIIERNENKRKYFRNIFLGFSTSENKYSFTLERFIHTLSQLSIKDIEILRDVDINRQDRNYQIYGNQDTALANIYNLISLGILLNDPSSRLGPINAPFVWISDYGKEFIKYLSDDKNS